MKTYQIGGIHYAEQDGMRALGSSRAEAISILCRTLAELERRAMAYPLAEAYAKHGKVKEALRIVTGDAA